MRGGRQLAGAIVRPVVGGLCTRRTTKKARRFFAWFLLVVGLTVAIGELIHPTKTDTIRGSLVLILLSGGYLLLKRRRRSK